MNWSTAPLQAHLCIWGVVHIHELVHAPVEPAHEEDAQGEAMRHQDQAGVVAEAAGVDVADHVVLKDGHAVVHISPASPWPWGSSEYSAD